MKTMKENTIIEANGIESNMNVNQTEESKDAMEAFVRDTEKIHKKRILKLKVLKVLGAIMVVATLICTKSRESKADIQHNIANEIIRFHVLANSDSADDQALKLKVKNKVVLYMQELLEDSKSKEQAEKMITEHREDILCVARQVIREQGYDYDVTARLEQCYFPVKVYGDLTFPAGDYDAFRILIGKAEGKNWWCVMFPNLCMVNDTYTIVPDQSKEELRNVLSEEEYDSISTTEEPSTTEEAEPEVEYHFWLVDWFASLF